MITNQEAAEMIRNDMKLHHDYLSGTYRKALNMAISALQALDEIYAFIMKSEASETTDGVLEIFDALEEEELKQEVKNSTESSLTQKKLDTISRQAAIDEIRKCRFVVDAIEKIIGLPSAHPESEHTMEEFMYGQDFGSPEDGSL